ncbi:hypothetical protein [Pyrobaculum aerophilum]|nr:hypothetical protein [Pyrobaculum aerophilum]
MCKTPTPRAPPRLGVEDLDDRAPRLSGKKPVDAVREIFGIGPDRW